MNDKQLLLLLAEKSAATMNEITTAIQSLESGLPIAEERVQKLISYALSGGDRFSAEEKVTLKNRLSITRQLRVYMQERQLAPEEIAEEIGCQPRQVYRWISGDAEPKGANLKGLKKLLEEEK